jgi:DNA repair exonuclease SbcCD ATPase subunit
MDEIEAEFNDVYSALDGLAANDQHYEEAKLALKDIREAMENLLAERDRLRADLAEARAENGNLFDRARMLAQEVLGLEADLAAMTERAEKAERENRVLNRMVEMSTGYIPMSCIPIITKDSFMARLRCDAEAELGKEPSSVHSILCSACGELAHWDSRVQGHVCSVCGEVTRQKGGDHA